MACCLTVALFFALVRKLGPGRGAEMAFAPPAFRPGPGELGSDRPAAAPARAADHAGAAPPSGAALWLGLGSGIVAYLVDVVLLSVSGAMSAEATVRGLLAVAVGTITALSWWSMRNRLRQADVAVALGVAGLTFGVLGLVEMHVTKTIMFTSPSTVEDVLFHAAGPLEALLATAVLLRFRRAPGPATSPPRVAATEPAAAPGSIFQSASPATSAPATGAAR